MLSQAASSLYLGRCNVTDNDGVDKLFVRLDDPAELSWWHRCSDVERVDPYGVCTGRSTVPSLMDEEMDSDESEAGGSDRGQTEAWHRRLGLSSDDDESSIIGGEGSQEATSMDPPHLWSFRGADNTDTAWAALSAAEKTQQIKFHRANRKQKQLPRVTKEMLMELPENVRKVSGTPSMSTEAFGAERVFASCQCHATARTVMPSWRRGTMFPPTASRHAIAEPSILAGLFMHKVYFEDSAPNTKYKGLTVRAKREFWLQHFSNHGIEPRDRSPDH